MKREYANEEVFRELHRRVAEYPTKRAAAASWEISPSYLNDLLKGMRPIPGRVAKALGFEKSVIYRKAS